MQSIATLNFNYQSNQTMNAIKVNLNFATKIQKKQN
jgi:hypothetical protein